MRALTEPLRQLDEYQKLAKALTTNKTPLLAMGVLDAQQSQLIYALSEGRKAPVLLLTYSEVRAKQLMEDMVHFFPEVLLYPAKDLLFYSADVRSKEIVERRLTVMERLLSGSCPFVVASTEAMLDRLPAKARFSDYILSLAVGDVMELDTLIEKLIGMGYERQEMIESMGQIAVRGGILDVYSPTVGFAYRIEFWDDEVDSIRRMDVNSQRSVEKIDAVQIFPVRELVFDEAEAAYAVQRIEAELAEVTAAYEIKGLEEEKERLTAYAMEMVTALQEKRRVSQAESFLPYFYEKTDSLLAYFPKDTLVCLDRPNRIREHMDTLLQEYTQSIENRLEKGFLLPGQASMRLDDATLYKEILRFPCLLLEAVGAADHVLLPKVSVSFSVREAEAFRGRMDLFCKELTSLQAQGYAILILAGASSRCERMVRELMAEGIEVALAKDWRQPVPKGSVWVAPGGVRQGFVYPKAKFALFSENELFHEARRKKKTDGKKNGVPLQSFTDLSVGDYVVHDSHGIGIFQGIRKESLGGVTKDYIVIQYADNQKLSVSVNNMDQVQKYIGSSGGEPKLSKMGGQEWGRAKARVRSSVKALAEDLVKLYAKRMAAKGFCYAPDNAWQREFEDAFPYEETSDQLAAIEDVKADMESERVMDRLICGDVGYGKTEVAIRAAFKAVQDGRQVAFLVPTTILAQQHYHTFLQRMQDYPIRVEVLSRFRTAKQQKETLKNLETGIADIIIGTHRLLSKDVKFKTLGLVIVDEEQRFGVGHKEKLKALKENLDVLTLTATPIPRTLHMSLVRIRDMSLLEEPPLWRQPIQTYVMEHSPAFIQEAIHRELARNGQVYYLYNRVSHIAEKAAELRKLVPEANIAYAHGQMTERELEGIMQDFVDGAIDVLVCTTIIETGLDISNVNTIIIQDADRMGLSQLYQLRGRVGRSSRVAYAYLLYRRDRVLKETAEKRLQTIREFTEFGSGFKIAMRDLEIRGAGNLLGAEQHGQMEAVGYDMYCRLLEEEVRNLQGETEIVPFETTVDVHVNAHIPEFYIKDDTQRMEIYKKIAAVQTSAQHDDLYEEIEDRYGDLPKSVRTLLEIVLLRSELHTLGVLSVVQKRELLLVSFRPDANIQPEQLTALISQGRGKYLFTAGQRPYLTIRMKKEETEMPLLHIKSMLHALKD